MLDAYLKEFEKLNEYQKKAVTSKEKYTVLNAVVGSGKTTVLTHKVLYEHFVSGTSLDNMVVLTFTNKAADEIRGRVTAFDESLNERIKYFGTFHSIARRLLLEKNLESIGYNKDFSVIDHDEAYEILNDIVIKEKLDIRYKSKLTKRVEEFKRGKTLYGIMKYSDDIEELFNIYKEEKRKRNIMDFDDLILNAIEVLEEPLNPKWIIVDEFQDTDERQLKLIRKIAGSDTNIFVIGDPNQVIYSFRTGCRDIFKEFKSIYDARELTLPFNYRSTRTIIEAAKCILNGEGISGVKEYGSPIVVRKHIDSFNEAMHIARKIKALNEEGVSFDNIGVLYRRKAQLDVISEVFGNNNIPYNIIFKKSLPFEDEEDEKIQGVNLLTMHASKGLEFSHVFIIGANVGNIPITSKIGEEEEEARLFFVAMTRAKKYLEISYVTKPGLPGVSGYASPYLFMIPNELTIREDDFKSSTLTKLMDMLREEKAKKDREDNLKIAEHEKYGLGKVIYEDENIIRVEFENYGEKEFSKMFCPIKITKTN